MYIREPLEDSFSEICRFIAQFELDDRELVKEQFLCAETLHKLAGFGRIREYHSCSELCSLGVIEPLRNKGIGRQLVRELIRKAPAPLYLVCIIPSFFEPLGFAIVYTYPQELKDKLDYCTTALSVPEPYVVMKYEANTGRNF